MAHVAHGKALALCISLLAHAAVALFLLLVAYSTPGTTPAGAGSDLVLSLFEDHDPPRLRAPPGEEEQHANEADFPVKVEEPGIAAGPTVPAPVLVGSAPGNSVPAGLGHPPGKGTAARHGGLFAVPPHARSVVFVVDRSLSMGLNGALARARQEVQASLSALSQATSFQVVFYNGQAEVLRIHGRRSFLTPDAETLRAVDQEIEHIVAAGPTDHVYALKTGLSLRPEVLFFVTDADDLTDQQVRELTRLNDRRTAIHAVELNRRRPEPDSPLQRLARDNGGTHRQVSPTD
jgi:hypothetical protein